MEIAIRNGNWDLASSGSMIIDSLVPTTLTLSANNNEILTLILKFEVSEPKTKNPQVKLAQLSSTSLEMSFVNFNNPLGTFVKELGKIGTFQNRNLYFGYFVTSFQEIKLKLFHYTFYLGEAVKNG